jgi:hypothetical protein
MQEIREDAMSLLGALSGMRGGLMGEGEIARLT